MNQDIATLEEIADKAACVVIDEILENEHDITYAEIYNEYLSQLIENDYQTLRTWIGLEIESGNKEAIEIMKMIIKLNLNPRK